MNISEESTKKLTSQDYVKPIFGLCIAILTNPSVDIEKAINSMKPNGNVQALGMITFLLDNGLTPDQIIERFIANSHGD